MNPSVTLSALLDLLPAGQATVLGGPPPAERVVRSMRILDPATAPTVTGADGIVLAVGVRSSRLGAAARAAAEAGAAALVVRAPADAARGLSTRWPDLAIVNLAPELSWSQAHGALIAALTPPPIVISDGRLGALAETVAALTGGMVTIEDPRAHVLAYSNSTGTIDELRRLSILGRNGPPEYLELLEKWGVYARLADFEDVVEVAEHPALGVRRRLAVGVGSGRRQLGTIWVQEGKDPFPPHAAQALLGAARVAAAELVGEPGQAEGPPDTAVVALLGGERQTLAGLRPSAAGRPCLVCAFALTATDTDRVERVLRLRSLRDIVEIRAAALRRTAAVGRVGEQVYAVLPDLADVSAAAAMARLVVEDSRHRGLSAVRAAIGPSVGRIADAARSRDAADKALSIGAGGGRTDPVTTYDSVRARLAVENAIDAVATRTELMDPVIAHLVADNPVLARTLLCYLDHGSDTVATARELDVHDTTVRHRLARIEQLGGVNFADPDGRLATHLQLRLQLGRSHRADPAPGPGARAAPTRGA